MKNFKHIMSEKEATYAHGVLNRILKMINEHQFEVFLEIYSRISLKARIGEDSLSTTYE
jgi:hypothetical protein